MQGFTSKGTFGNVQTVLAMKTERVLLAYNEQSIGMLPNILQSQYNKECATKNYAAPNANNAEVEKPCSGGC